MYILEPCVSFNELNISHIFLSSSSSSLGIHATVYSMEGGVGKIIKAEEGNR